MRGIFKKNNASLSYHRPGNNGQAEGTSGTSQVHSVVTRKVIFWLVVGTTLAVFILILVPGRVGDSTPSRHFELSKVKPADQSSSVSASNGTASASSSTDEGMQSGTSSSQSTSVNQTNSGTSITINGQSVNVPGNSSYSKTTHSGDSTTTVNVSGSSSSDSSNSSVNISDNSSNSSN